MHRAIAILLLILVPVRVFGAEAVGLCMLKMAGTQVQAESAMPDDCPMMKQGHAPAKHEPKHAPDCQSCEMCMPMAGPEDVAVVAAGKPPSTLLSTAGASFHSAEVSRALKPPIA